MLRSLRLFRSSNISFNNLLFSSSNNNSLRYFCSSAENSDEISEENSTKVTTRQRRAYDDREGLPTRRRKKRLQVPGSVFRRHFVNKFVRQWGKMRDSIYPVAEVVHLYERRVKWHKRFKEWEENQTFKLLRRKEREGIHRDVERKYKNWRDKQQTDNLHKWQTQKDLRTDANIQALDLLKKTEHLWDHYPDEMQDLKYDIRRAHRPYYTRYN